MIATFPFIFNTCIQAPPHHHDTKEQGTPPGIYVVDYDDDGDDVDDDDDDDVNDDDDDNLSLRRGCKIAGEKSSMSGHSGHIFRFKC